MLRKWFEHTFLLQKQLTHTLLSRKQFTGFFVAKLIYALHLAFFARWNMPSGKLKLFGPLGGGWGWRRRSKSLIFPILSYKAKIHFWRGGPGGSPIKDFFLKKRFFGEPSRTCLTRRAWKISQYEHLLLIGLTNTSPRWIRIFFICSFSPQELIRYWVERLIRVAGIHWKCAKMPSKTLIYFVRCRNIATNCQPLSLCIWKHRSQRSFIHCFQKKEGGMHRNIFKVLKPNSEAREDLRDLFCNPQKLFQAKKQPFRG